MAETFIYSAFPIDQDLMDIRVGRYGITFGSISFLCKQYGIKCEKTGDVYRYSADKSRLQLFIEKMHFSGTPYTDKP